MADDDTAAILATLLAEERERLDGVLEAKRRSEAERAYH